MPTIDRTTYATGKAKHAYDVEAYQGAYIAVSATIFTVYATNRDQAARRVERDGWNVASVNMVG